MAISSFLTSISALISPSSRILQDVNSLEFMASMERWSSYGVKSPLAIVQPGNEQDIVYTVQEALRASIPFVAASGGHSPWSNIGPEGIVIDLSRYKGVTVDRDNNLAAVKGGTLMKELQVALHPHKKFTAVGNGNTVGAIPYYLGGGISVYTPFTGFGSENIVSAKLVNAKGELLEVSEAINSELLWALRGAGQFFGLVTELTIKIYPYSLLGNDNGQRMCGTYIFLPHQINEVCATLEKIMESKQHVSAGHFMIAQAPPNLKQKVLLLAPQVFCSADEAAKLFQPLVDLKPIQQMLVPSTFDTHSDHIDWVCAKGDIKDFTQIGLAGWNTTNFKRLAELHLDLIENCLDAARSVYTVEWHSPCRAERKFESSFGHENVDYWLNILNWSTNAENHAFITEMDQKAQAAMRVGTEQEAFVSYTNCTRDDPLEYRYKGVDRIAKLKNLKKHFDPDGVYTKQLL